MIDFKTLGAGDFMKQACPNQIQSSCSYLSCYIQSNLSFFDCNTQVTQAYGTACYRYRYERFDGVRKGTFAKE